MPASQPQVINQVTVNGKVIMRGSVWMTRMREGNDRVPRNLTVADIDSSGQHFRYVRGNGTLTTYWYLFTDYEWIEESF